MGVPVVIGGDNLPSPVVIGLTDLKNIGGGASGPPGPPVPASLLGDLDFGSWPLDHVIYIKLRKKYLLAKGHVFCTEIKIQNSESHDLGLLSLYTF